MAKANRLGKKGKDVEYYYDFDERKIESILKDIQKYSLGDDTLSPVDPDDPASTAIIKYNDFMRNDDKCAIGSVNVNPTFIIHEASPPSDSSQSNLSLHMLAVVLVAILLALIVLIYMVYRLYRASEKRQAPPQVNPILPIFIREVRNVNPTRNEFVSKSTPKFAITEDPQDRLNNSTGGNRLEATRSQASSTNSSPGLPLPPAIALLDKSSETVPRPIQGVVDSNKGVSIEERQGSMSPSENLNSSNKQVDSRGANFNYLMDFVQTKVVSSRFGLNKHLSSGVQTNCKELSSIKFMVADTDTLPLEDGKFKKSFTKSESIGRGSYGEVYKAVHRLDGKVYAVKRIELDESEIADMKKYGVFREVMAMAGINHDNVVRFITCWLESHDAEEDINSSGDESSPLESGTKPRRMRSKSHSVSIVDGSCMDSSFCNESADASALNIVFGEPGQVSMRKAQSSIKSGFDESFAKAQVSIRKKSHCPSKKMHLYIQMEYCSGESLSQILRRHPLNRLDTFILFVQLLKGVSYIHQKGIIHRDLK